MRRHGRILNRQRAPVGKQANRADHSGPANKKEPHQPGQLPDTDGEFPVKILAD
jgi:hypothetical protein